MGMCLNQLGYYRNKTLEKPHILLLSQGETLQNKGKLNCLNFLLFSLPKDATQEEKIRKKTLNFLLFIYSTVNRLVQTKRSGCPSFCGIAKEGKKFILCVNI